MTKEEALELLLTAPLGDEPSAVNPQLTMTHAVKIVTNGTRECKCNRVHLSALSEKRVWQVVKNQKRPRYKKTHNPWW